MLDTEKRKAVLTGLLYKGINTLKGEIARDDMLDA